MVRGTILRGRKERLGGGEEDEDEQGGRSKTYKETNFLAFGN
jgi:hypothetical protein